MGYHKDMQKYVLVKFLEPIPEGAEFPASNWPLHITLAANFVVDAEGTDLLARLSSLLAQQKPVKAIAGDDEYFGPQKQVHVTVIEPSPELQSLHGNVVALLESVGAVFDGPRYIKESYRAHATVQLNARLHKGDAITIDELTLVDMLPGGDSNQRKVLQTFILNEVKEV